MVLRGQPLLSGHNAPQQGTAMLGMCTALSTCALLVLMPHALLVLTQTQAPGWEACAPIYTAAPNATRAGIQLTSQGEGRDLGSLNMRRSDCNGEFKSGS